MADKESNGISPCEKTSKNKIRHEDQENGTEESSARKVSDWVRRSVLFWNKQDTVSIDESSDIQENDCESDGLVLENCAENNTEDINQVQPKTETEAVKKPSLTADLFLDVEKIQKLCIDPFIMETAENQEDVFGGKNLSTDSPYYTLNFPKYTQHMYSPLYEEHRVSFNGSLAQSKVDENDWNIADTLNKLNQTWGQVDSSAHNKPKDQKEPGESINNYATNNAKMDSKQRNYNVDVLNSIKRVQETLGEIAAELENTRTRKTSRERDPNVILINLLSRIEPPVNRDSYTGSVVEETSQFVSQSTTDLQTTIKGKLEIPASGLANMASSQSEGDNSEDFDVLKELSNPDKSTETVLEQFMQKLSAAEKPSSTIRGLLRRISEEITGENAADDLAHPEGNVSQDQLTTGLNERRVSSVSGHSSMPTSPNTINYDSGFSEHPKTSQAATKDLFTSILPDDTKQLKLVKEALDENQRDRDSETSTDWSPYSTLSMGETPFRASRTTAFQASSVRRSSARRRSTGAVNSRPSSKMMGSGAGSCPSFDGNCPSPAMGSGIRYSRTEVEAIRKFLSLTSVYFGSRGTGNEMGNLAYDELMEKEDIEKIHEMLQNQRDDLEKQRHQQEGLLRRLGEMLLQLVTLKEEHLTSTQKQTKALTLLKKQLDIQRKEQSKSHEAVKEQMKTLEEQLKSQMTIIHEQSTSESLPAIVTVDTPKIDGGVSDGVSKGHIIWKISGITRKLTRIHAGASEGVSVSESFYSGPFGYKMAAWLYLNGRGDYKGKGMSIYVCPLSGEYDAILHWPIRPIYTFTLVDQNPETASRHDHTKVRRTPEISKKGDTLLSTRGGIPRPQNGSKSFIIGFDDFVSQSELAQGSYILDDTLFLKIEAEIKQ